MTRGQALSVVALFAANYPVPAWSEETIEIQAQLIEDLDYDSTKACAMTWMKTQRERPTVADLRRAVAGQQHGNYFLAAEDAWGYVVHCLIQLGHTHPFPDRYPLIAAAVERMGWMNLCMSENQVADRARFLQIYAALLERGLVQTADSAGAARAPELSSATIRERREPKTIEGPKTRSLDSLVRQVIEGKRATDESADQPDIELNDEHCWQIEERRAELRRQAKLLEEQQ